LSLKTTDNLLNRLTIEPREYQTRLIEKSLSMYRGTFENSSGQTCSPAKSVMIESPTGSGKTVMGLSIASCLQQEFGVSVGWVAMRRNLLSQADKELQTRDFPLEMQLISMFDRNPPSVDLLVVDECQHDAAPAMANLHAAVRPNRILGLSATPYRTDRVKLCFEHTIRDAGIQELIRLDYLSTFDHYTIDEYSPQSVADHFAREPDHWGQSLIFFHRTEECFACKSALADHGITADVVTAKTDREQQIDAFEQGKTKVLISMAILTEGFDCPQLQTVFCRPSSKGCTIQMCGRVLRKWNPSVRKQLVQCRNTKHPFTKTAEPARQFIWDNGWKNLSFNHDLARVTDTTRMLVARRRNNLPRYLTQNHGPGGRIRTF